MTMCIVGRTILSYLNAYTRTLYLYAWYNGKTVGAHYQAASYGPGGKLYTTNLMQIL